MYNLPKRALNIIIYHNVDTFLATYIKKSLIFKF